MKGLEKVSQQTALRAGVLLAALAALVWAGLSRGWFDGVTLAIAVLALGLSLLQRLPIRPHLMVSPRTGDQLTLRHEESVRPFDEDAIVAEQVAACEKEMPRLPRPNFPPGTPFVGHLAGADASERFDELISGVSDQRLRAYMDRVSDYSIKVRKWLAAVEAARADRLRVADGQLRIRELGRAPADHVRLRIRFPEGFAIDEELPEVPRPPHRPRFDGSSLGRITEGVLFRETYFQPNLRIRLPGTDAPDYMTDDGKVVVSWDLGHVNQSERVEVPVFSLKAPEPGVYSAEWEVTADGLPRGAKGTLPIVVEPPGEAEPICTMAEVEDERKARELAIRVTGR
jgi:hypothetical protein